MSSVQFGKPLRRLFVLGVVASLGLHCSSGGNGGGSDQGGEGGDANGAEGGDVAEGGSGANSNTGGSANAGGTSQGGGGSAGAAGMGVGGSQGGKGGVAAGGAAGSAMGGSVGTVAQDPKPWFSFFTTSEAGIVSLSTDKTDGMGGDLGGLAGADSICMKLAQKANPGDTKVWRAFLSVKAGPNGTPVNAIDRVGKGPWYNFKKVLLAKTVTDLVPDAQDDGRPTHYTGADENRPLLEMFTDENGDPVRPRLSVDNHDTLTGSDKNGKYANGGTCNDWTSTDENLQPPMIGHSWPRSSNNGRHWISDHAAGGCGKGIDTRLQAGNGTKTVGSGGGYGGIYCFAVAAP